MAILSRVRLFAFLVIVVAALVPAAVQAADPLCPTSQCTGCPREWGYGSCWSDSNNCQNLGCRGSFGTCQMEGGGGLKEVCVCPECNQ
jgi:hypothetical protein